MATIEFFKRIKSSPKADLLLQGYSRRTTASEPRLSELVAEYQRIGYEVEIIQHEVEPNACGVCFEASDEKANIVYCDIFVRSKQSRMVEGAADLLEKTTN